MELRNLKTFMAVSEHLNLSKAAEQLGYTQPTVTIQIKALEEELGHTLISRSGNKTFLTPAGELLKKHGEKVFAQLQEMKQDLNQLDKVYGNLVIASPEFYCSHYLYLILKDYFKQYPQVNIRLVSCNSIEAVRMVHENKADIGIVGAEYQLSDIESIVIDREDLLFVASTELLQRIGEVDVLEELPILFDKNLEALSKKLFEEMNYSPPSIIECSSEETIKRSVLNQIGVCIIGSAMVEREVADGTLTVLHRFAKGLNTSIVYKKSRKPEQTIQTFSELVKEKWGSIKRSIKE